MSKVLTNINTQQNNKWRSSIETSHGTGTTLLQATYYVDATAYWKRTNYGIRLSENNYLDLIYPNKYNPTGGRFEHNWYGVDKENSYVEEKTSTMILFFNKPTNPELNPDVEGVFLDKAREVVWDPTTRQYLIDGTPAVIP